MGSDAEESPVAKGKYRMCSASVLVEMLLKATLLRKQATWEFLSASPSCDSGASLFGSKDLPEPPDENTLGQQKANLSQERKEQQWALCSKPGMASQGEGDLLQKV